MRIRWTEPASRDLTQICDYLSNEDSQATARRIAILIHETREPAYFLGRARSFSRFFSSDMNSWTSLKSI